MPTLYHLWLDPGARMVRLALGEKRLPFAEAIVRPGDDAPVWPALGPGVALPVLVEDDGHALADGRAICHYLDECAPDPPLIGASPRERAETARLVGWFDGRFGAEVTRPLVGEKVDKRLAGAGYPDARRIRAALAAIDDHLGLIDWLAERRRWLAGDRFSLADIVAAAHLSAIDYLGDVPWERHAEAKDWYARVKSRPAFRPLLRDLVPGLAPPRHYADLDF